jgi:hypothetical protein
VLSRFAPYVLQLFHIYVAVTPVVGTVRFRGIGRDVAQPLAS